MKRYRFDIEFVVACPDDEKAEEYTNELRRDVAERTEVISAEMGTLWEVDYNGERPRMVWTTRTGTKAP